MSYSRIDVAIAGAGAAGFFSALAVKEQKPDLRVCIFEKTGKILSKVSVSGGGRCNVTNYCFDHEVLARAYPRGSEFLKHLFTRFDTASTIRWFEKRGVRLKHEADGRMFPVSDDSQTVVDCFTRESRKKDIEIKTNCPITSIEPNGKGFLVHTPQGTFEAKKLILCSGGSPTDSGYNWLRSMGITCIPPRPSLFTFNMPDEPIRELQGVAVEEAKVSLPAFKVNMNAPLLITHWGLSGPAVIKASAFAARELADINYDTRVIVDFLPAYNRDKSAERLKQFALANQKKQVLSLSPFEEIPLRLWKFLIAPSLGNSERNWAETGKKLYQILNETLHAKSFHMKGKTTFKEEFVTCGGVDLNEIDQNTLECTKVPGLYFAGEILNIDGITGGFNFQAAWTTAYIAGTEAAASIQSGKSF